MKESDQTIMKENKKVKPERAKQARDTAGRAREIKTRKKVRE